MIQRCDTQQYGMKRKAIDTGILSKEVMPEGIKIGYCLENQFKRGDITKEEYITKYIDQLNANKDIIIEWFMKQVELYKEVFVTCTCKENELCHTYVLINWLNKLLNGDTNAQLCLSDGNKQSSYYRYIN